MKNFKATKEYKELKRSLLDDLESRGLVEPIYKDKAQEYLDFWVMSQELGQDIKDRGYTVMDEKRGMLVENRSVSLRVQVSRQMQQIFTALGFKDLTAMAKCSEDDDEL